MVHMPLRTLLAIFAEALLVVLAHRHICSHFFMCHISSQVVLLGVKITLWLLKLLTSSLTRVTSVKSGLLHKIDQTSGTLALGFDDYYDQPEFGKKKIEVEDVTGNLVEECMGNSG